MPKYERAIIFTKKGNLHDYLHTDKVRFGTFSGELPQQTKSRYEAEREIQLIALVRWETDGAKKSKYICRIKCPVSPLPVKGEFELPSLGSLYVFLRENGWTYKRTFYYREFERIFE